MPYAVPSFESEFLAVRHVGVPVSGVAAWTRTHTIAKVEKVQIRSSVSQEASPLCGLCA